MAFYESIAPWYDYIFPYSPAQKKFIETELDGLAGKHLLDVGCGTGNLALRLAEAGAFATGIDLDDQMLSLARHKGELEKRVEFVKLDMLHLQRVILHVSQDAVVCLGNTLVHLPSPGKILSFFNQVSRVIKPGGKLLFQIINYDYVLDEGLDRLPFIDNEFVMFERNYEFREQDELINFKTTLTIKESGRVIRNSVPLFPARRELLLHLLDKADFSKIRFFGSFDGSPATTSSLLLIVTAEK